uniref:Uncharacterized protein n=1 Tax=Arundo donax TaxID=35708 RepID=A0A0A9EK62_ARUDO
MVSSQVCHLAILLFFMIVNLWNLKHCSMMNFLVYFIGYIQIYVHISGGVLPIRRS